MQARLLTYTASRLWYKPVAGGSPRFAVPVNGGPFDRRLGYSSLPAFLERAATQAYRISRQTEQSAALARLIHWGVPPPYRESARAGLVLGDRHGSVVFEGARSDRNFADFDSIPPLLVRTLLFFENRGLQEDAGGRTNPVIEWRRLAKASVAYAAHKLGLPVPLEGGSTLATQLEKFRHSPNGRTNSVVDKGRQILAASLKAYREGEDTWSWRRAIVVDYLNTMPLAARPGYGEIYGLGEGLHAWFGMGLENVAAALKAPDRTPAKVSAYKHALALIVSLRAPSAYLARDRAALERRTDQMVGLLARSGILDAEFARAVQAAPLRFAPPPPLTADSFVARKAVNAVRVDLLKLFGLSSLYDLDRLHLEVETTGDARLQRQVAELLQKLRDPAAVEALGLNRSKRLLAGADPRKVNYSFLLYERTAAGNALRVQADSLNQPFDLNRGMKLELGSTAKLRAAAHYLELMAMLFKELASLEAPVLQSYASRAQDPLSRWSAEILLREKEITLEAFLQRALERRYSASPAEPFFTGGGVHTFRNFSSADNERILSVREALERSTNLVFIRLMRDLVRFHQTRLPYDAELLSDINHPWRRALLEEIAEEESKTVLMRAHKRYQGLAADELIRRFLRNRAASPRHLAILFFAWNSERDKNRLADWLERYLGTRPPDFQVENLWRAYSNPRLTIADYGYLLSRNSLEVWCAGQFYREPNLAWDELFSRSGEARRVASAWLFKTRNQRAQNLRLRNRIERDAFARMTPHWRRLGFPFAELVPSYATAIGNSADQPRALAELMGIILNDGLLRPSFAVKRLRWAPGTPYETVMEAAPQAEERILDPAVARVLKSALAGVVEQGTAQGVRGAFRRPGEASVVIGGKTGSGDNRFHTFDRRGRVLASRAVNRTATFVFYFGDRHFGVITAFVDGAAADRYRFTSALPVAILKLLAPAINEELAAPHEAAQRAIDAEMAGDTYAQSG